MTDWDKVKARKPAFIRWMTSQGITRDSYNAMGNIEQAGLLEKWTYGPRLDESFTGNLGAAVESTLSDYAGAGGRIAAAGLKPIRGYLVGGGILAVTAGTVYVVHRLKKKQEAA